ncbi:MAG: DNA repair protein RadC [Cyanobacteria bacterium J06641_5]
MTYRLRIADLPASERPRERLLASGAGALADAELLAILFGTGQGAGKLSAVGLGQHLLQQLGQDRRDPLAALRETTAVELMQIAGIGPAKATTVLAAIELGRRLFAARLPVKAPIDSPEAAAATLAGDLMWQTQERFAVLLLDGSNRLLGVRVLTIGTATETLAHPRDIFREVVRQGATQAIVAHNHPSGELTPSSADLMLTEQLLQGAIFLQLPLLDHLILGNGDFRSLRQTTELWERYPQK